MKRRHLSFAITLSLLVLCLPLSAVAGSEEQFSIVCGPYLQSPSETAMTVMWITNKDATGWVEYGAGDSLGQKAFSSRDGLVDANTRIHRVKLDGLKPGVEYRYRVVTRDILNFEAYKVDFGATLTTDVHRFTTLDRGKDEFAFLVFTDIHEHLDMVPQLLRVNGDRPYDLVFFDGDIISHIEGEQQIVDFINAIVEQFASEIPFVWVRGNHETRGKFARMLSRYIDSPSGRYFYSLDHGPAHFIMVDTGEDKEDSHPAYSGLVDFDAYRKEQSRWLDAEIQTEAFRGAAFRIGIAHMPFPRPAGNNRHGMEDTFASFGRQFNEGGVDVLFSGHQHRYGIHEPEPGRHDYPVVQGGAHSEDSRTLIRVEVSRDQLDASIIRADGEVVGARRVAARGQ